MNIRYWWHWLMHGVPIYLSTFGGYYCRKCNTVWIEPERTHD